jgi:hypothetical protein
MRIITTLPRTPRMNAICERVIGTRAIVPIFSSASSRSSNAI